MKRSESFGFLLLLAAGLAMLTVGGCGKSAAGPSDTRKVLGTTVTITVLDQDRKETDLKPLFEKSFATMADWEKKTLTPGKDNQVAAIATMAGQQSVSTDNSVFEMLMKAIRLYDTGGKVFDIRYGPMLDLWGFDSTPHVPGKADLDSMKSLVTDGGMFVAGSSILLAKKGMRFDVRDFVTAYVFDLVAADLSANGIHSALITSPRIVRVVGTPPTRQGFKVSLSHPLKSNEPWATATVRSGGVVCVSAGDGSFESQGKSYHRILDPRTGLPASGCTAVIVQSSDAATAYALAYSAFVLGTPDALPAEGKSLAIGSALVQDSGGQLKIVNQGSLATGFEVAK